METTDDIRMKEGNPRAGQPNTDPLPVNRVFGQHSAPRGLAITLLVIGMFVTAVGSITFIVPLMVVGVLVLISSLFYFLRSSSAQTG